MLLGCAIITRLEKTHQNMSQSRSRDGVCVLLVYPSKEKVTKELN